jgi:hypothetical protein
MYVNWKRPRRFRSAGAPSTVASKREARNSHFRSAFLASGIVLMFALAGCTIGPRMYESSFNDYNDAIRKTSDGQMLANLVRMRYFESPIFLQVASVSTNFTLNTSVGATGTFNQGAANSSGLSAGAGFSENPTITFSLPESREYYGRLMAPLSADQITLLIEAGFDSEVLMRTAIRRINRLRNLTIEYSTYPQAPSSYAEFLEVFALIKKLSFEGLVEFGPGLGTTVWSAPVGPVDHGGLSGVALLATQVFAQWTAGGELIPNEKNEIQLHTFKRRMSLRFAPAAVDSPDAQRLRKLLSLSPEKNAFPISDLELTKIEKGRAYTGASPAALDPTAIWPSIGLQGRSMMEIMQIASAAVQVPAKDTEAGIAFVDPSVTSDAGGDWLVVRSSKDEPENASLRIRYRDQWFYVADNDLQSREAFALLNALFAVTGGTVPGANPILTLPVN